MRKLVIVVLVLAVFGMGAALGTQFCPPCVKCPPPPVEQPAMSQRGASILSCPVTKASIEEYYRICRARKRMEEVKPT